MQEDKISKEIADSLRKYQENHPQAYEQGTWEAFEKSRKSGGFPWLPVFISGIAACLLLGLGYTWISQDFQSDNIDQNEVITSIESEFELPTTPAQVDSISKEELEIKTDPVSPENLIAESSKVSSIEPVKSESTEQSISNFQSKELVKDSGIPKEKTSDIPFKSLSEAEFKQKLLAGDWSNSSNSEAKNSYYRNRDLADSSEISNKIDETSWNMALAEEEKRSKNSKAIAWEVGVAPAFGGGTGDGGGQVSSSSLGLGMALAVPVTEKIRLGTGLALNTLSQQSEVVFSPANAFASSIAPSEERITVNQAQVELPLFVQYPINPSNTISIRAGFSSIYAINQQADVESSFTRQVVVANDAANSSINDSRIIQESVVQNTSLEPANQRFYPFATANFGLNIQLLERKNVNYVLMPFYNLPLTDFTGFGENPGLVGASFKVNFGK